MKPEPQFCQITPEYFDAWNTFVNTSPQGAIFCHSWWLEAITKGNFKILAIFENDEIVAGIPLAYYLGKINEPPLTRTLGPLFKELPEYSEHDKTTIQRKWLNLLLDHISIGEVEQFCTSNNFTDWLPFRWRGYRQTTRYTYLIDYAGKGEKELWAGLNRGRKETINKALKNHIAAKVTTDPGDFYKLIELTYQRQGLAFRFAFDDFKLLDEEIVKYNQRVILTAFDDKGNTHAAIFVVFNSREAFALLSAGDPAYRHLGGHTLVMWEAMKYFNSRVKCFNFGGSDIQRIENHLGGFGGELKQYFHIYTEKPPIKEAEKLIEKEIIREVPVLPDLPPDNWQFHVEQIFHHTNILIKKTLWKFGVRFTQPVVFSIITACHNHGKYIGEMLESLFNQTYSNFEVIIVNDGSTDDTSAILDKIKHRKVKVIHTFHRGPAHARNLAIQNAGGEYIFNLDADDKIAPQMLQKCLEVLATRPNVGIVYTDVDFFGAKTGRFTLPEFSMENMLSQNCIVSIAAFRKADWEQTEGYSEALTNGYEDYDFWLSILKLGRSVFKIKQSLTFYRAYSDPGISRSGKRKKDPLKVMGAIVQVFRRHRDLFKGYPQIFNDFVKIETEFDELLKNQFNNPDRPVFSIITPTNNRLQMLQRAIGSVQRQNFPDYEHIIVDDASNDETRKLISDLNDPRIKYLRHEKPGGAAAAYNTGMKAARGRFINFLDDDDEYLPGILQKQFDCFETSSANTGFIWTGVTRVKDTETGEEPIRTQVWTGFFDSQVQGLMVSTAIGNGFGLSVRKECIENIGEYDESLVVGEDTDFMIRLSMQFNFRTIPEVLVKIHHHGQGQLTHEKYSRIKWESYGRILRRHHRFFSKYWDVYYMHHQVYTGLCYQLNEKKAGRKALWRLAKTFPTRRIILLDWLCYEMFGLNYIAWKSSK